MGVPHQARTSGSTSRATITASLEASSTSKGTIAELSQNLIGRCVVRRSARQPHSTLPPVPAAGARARVAPADPVAERFRRARVVAAVPPAPGATQPAPAALLVFPDRELSRSPQP